MMNRVRVFGSGVTSGFAIALLASVAFAQVEEQAVGESQVAAAEVQTDGADYALSLKMKSIDGREVNLSDYRGKALLIVNTASKCGFTPQYKGLQAIHERYAAQGLRVLGFPCNQFRGQEPGDESEIQQFCQKNYGVKFDMFAKVDVKGDQQCELYKYLTAQESSPKSAGNVSWNFEKFLVDGEGKVVARFGSRVKPTSDRITTAIEKLIAQ